MKRVLTGDTKLPVPRRVPKAAAYGLELAVIAVGYAILGEAGQSLPSLNPTAAPCWPPTGIALALLLLCGYRVWPAIMVGSFCAGAIASLTSSSSIDDHLILSCGIAAIGTTIAALCGAWLINRLSKGRDTLETAFGIVRFALIAVVPVAAISSAAAVAGLYLSGDFDFGGYSTWATWWLADAGGTLIVAPVILLWAMTPLRPSSASNLSTWNFAETAAILVLAGVIGSAAFNPEIGAVFDDVRPYQGLFGFLILLPLLWACLRGNPRDAATATLIFCGVAIWGLSQGADTLLQTDLNNSLLLLFALSVSAALASLILATVIAGFRKTDLHLRADVRKANNEIVQTSMALESSRRLFQILIEGVDDYFIFVIDTGGHVASWNNAAQQITGYSADEILGQHFGIFYRPDERRAGEPNRALEGAAQKGKYEVEGWRIKKNGALLFVTGSVTAVRDKNGTLVGFANILRDTTERRDAQEKLVEAREQLAMSQKMEAIGKLTGGIAHDFNNLLMIIGGNAQTFKRLLDPKLPRAIEAIQVAAKRGESLTRQLLTFARRQHLNPTVVDLNNCIRDMRTMIESSLRGNIVYSEKIDPNVSPVRVDLAELELAIVNIAVNARDAMPNGGTFGITIGNVTAHRDDERSKRDFVAIEFADSGTGIPTDLLTKVFDPFFTTKEVGKGTGLGLSQVYGFTHQSGGMVTADSKVGEGTKITLFLPALAEGEAIDEETKLDIVHPPRPSVLIVDDSAEVAEVTSSLFEDLGYATMYRESADAALKLLADGTKIDLVFSDIVMPGTIDGVGLAGEIKAQYPDLPVILTTGYSDAARTAPAHLKILRKPFDSASLKGCIQEALEVPLSY
jgi:PAS domain S-box-containing protein